jgi:hypothetical protein
MILEGEATPVSRLSQAFLNAKSPDHLMLAYYQAGQVVAFMANQIMPFFNVPLNAAKQGAERVRDHRGRLGHARSVGRCVKYTTRLPSDPIVRCRWRRAPPTTS